MSFGSLPTPVPPTAPDLRLEPHNYPTYIKLFAFTTIGIFVYAMTLLPSYFSSAVDMKNVEEYFNNKNYTEAITSLQKILKITPDSKKAKLLIAKAYFSDENKENDVEGLEVLESVSLNDREWQDLNTVMPAEYQQYFINETKKD